MERGRTAGMKSVELGWLAWSDSAEYLVVFDL